MPGICPSLGDGNELMFQRFIAPNIGTVTFSKAGDRRVIGSMNDMVHMVRIVMVQGNKDLDDIARFINRTPFFMLKGTCHPKEEFRMMGAAV
jgi:hypothetical protein